MKNNQRIVFLGTPAFAVLPLQRIVEAGYNVVAVVTNRDKKAGRKNILTPPPVKTYALSQNIPVYQYDKIRTEGVEDMKALAPDLMITCAFGQILSQEILDIPRLGVYNVHGSLLPKFRGASPVQAAVLCGEEQTGITVMKTEVGLDSGDMLLKKSMPLRRETADELFEKLSVLGAEAILEALPLILSGAPHLEKQDPGQVTKTGMIRKENSFIDWQRSAWEIDCFVRGMYSSPGARTLLLGEEVKILAGYGEKVAPGNGDSQNGAGQKDFAQNHSAPKNSACNTENCDTCGKNRAECTAFALPEQGKTYVPGTVISAGKGGVFVACGKAGEEVFRLDTVQFPGGKAVSAKDAALGRKLMIGQVFSMPETPEKAEA